MNNQHFLPGESLRRNLLASHTDSYPPNRHGLRGQDMASTALGHGVRDGKFSELPKEVVDTGEEYDLVINGKIYSRENALRR